MTLSELIEKEKHSSIPQNCLAAHILDLAFDMDWIPLSAEESGFSEIAQEIQNSEILMSLAERIALPNE